MTKEQALKYCIELHQMAYCFMNQGLEGLYYKTIQLAEDICFAYHISNKEMIEGKTNK